jgi:hypothetical protein
MSCEKAKRGKGTDRKERRGAKRRIVSKTSPYQCRLSTIWRISALLLTTASSSPVGVMKLKGAASF